MGTTRQTKGRSRTGCKQCRIDRKKCDETRPVCGRCDSRRVSCDFDRPLGVRLGNRRRSRSLVATSSVPDGYPPDESPQNSLSYHGGSPQASTSLQYRQSSYMPDYTSPEQQRYSNCCERADILCATARTHGTPSTTSSLIPSIPVSNVLDSAHAFGVIRSPTPMERSSLDMGTVAQDLDPFNDLLMDLFGTSVPNMTASMSLIFGPGGPIQSEFAEMALEQPGPVSQSRPQFPASHSPNAEPRDVQRRFNAPLDPRASLLSTISAPVIATLSDLDARLFYHYIDIQATISIAMEIEDNPLTKHLIPVSLSSALEGTSQDNPAFHAMKASAATHRANLMERTGTDGARAFRDIAHEGRKAAYALLATRLETLPKASVIEREQFGGALCTLVSLAVVDGNTRLLPRLLEAYGPCIQKVKDLTPHELFFISAISTWQTWYNFTLTVVLNQSPVTPLSETLPAAPHCSDVLAIFAVPPKIAAEHMRIYKLIRKYRSSHSTEALNAQIEADELITTLEHDLARDLEAPDFCDASNLAEHRVAIGRVIHHAALRVLLLREIFQCPRDDYQIQQCVRHGLEVLAGVKWGTEAGLLIPLVILSSAAYGHDQQQYRTFMFRLCWKGSSGPRAALAMLDMVMENRGLDWKDAMARMGSVILV